MYVNIIGWREKPWKFCTHLLIYCFCQVDSNPLLLQGPAADLSYVHGLPYQESPSQGPKWFQGDRCHCLRQQPHSHIASSDRVRTKEKLSALLISLCPVYLSWSIHFPQLCLCSKGNLNSIQDGFSCILCFHSVSTCMQLFVHMCNYMCQAILWRWWKFVPGQIICVANFDVFEH